MSQDNRIKHNYEKIITWHLNIKITLKTCVDHVQDNPCFRLCQMPSMASFSLNFCLLLFVSEILFEILYLLETPIPHITYKFFVFVVLFQCEAFMKARLFQTEI